MAAIHGNHVSVTHRYRHSCQRNFINFCCKQIQQSTWLGRSERSVSLCSCCRLSSFQQSHVLKSSLGRKSEHCPYPKFWQSIKRITMNFLTKQFSWGGGEERFVLPKKAFIGSILKFWSFLHYLIWLLQSNSHGKKTKMIIFHLGFATFWFHYICVFACLWLCLTENRTSHLID